MRKWNWVIIAKLTKATASAEEIIYPQETVFAKLVAEEDQKYRFKYFWRSSLCFLLLGVFISINRTSLHGFYRDQLAELWLLPHPEYAKRIPLRALQNCAVGGPLHLLHGTATLTGLQRQPGESLFDLMTFSKLHVGSQRLGYCPTDKYPGEINLGDVMAISGAAVSPTSVDNVLVRALLVLFNFRLGMWCPNPSRPPADFSWPSPLRAIWGYLFTEPEIRDYVFVSDGGHIENTGIGPLLQRRCRVIIAQDATEDGDYQLADVQKLLENILKNEDSVKKLADELGKK